jgi:hypothetical protein
MPSTISSFSPSILLANYSLSELRLQSALISTPQLATDSPAHPVLTLGGLPEITVRSYSFGTSANGMYRQVQINMDVGTLSPQLFAAAVQKQYFAQATLTVPDPAVANGQIQFTLFDVRVTSIQISSTTCAITLDFGSLASVEQSGTHNA